MSHDGLFLITVDIEGHALFINYPKQVVLHRFNFKRKVYDIKFSPNNEYFAVTFGHNCQIWKSPSTSREFVPLTLKRTIGGHFDDTTCLDWSSDSRSLVMGSKDLTCRVYTNVRSKFMSLHKLSGHRSKILGVYFADDNKTIYSIAQDGAVFTWKVELDPTPQFPIKKNSTKRASKKDFFAEDRPRSSAAVDNDAEGEEDDEDGYSDESSYVESDSDEEGNEEEEEGGAGDDQARDPSDIDALLALRRKYRHSTSQRLRWALVTKEFLWDNTTHIASTHFQQRTSLLVVGFDNGVFGLYEMPGCHNFQKLSISNSKINTATISPSGEWLALGSAALSQILVWEWKSESYILKQQGHLYGMNAVDFS